MPKHVNTLRYQHKRLTIAETHPLPLTTLGYVWSIRNIAGPPGDSTAQSRTDVGEKSETVTNVRGHRGWTNGKARNEAKIIDRRLFRGSLFTLRVIN